MTEDVDPVPPDARILPRGAVPLPHPLTDTEQAHCYLCGRSLTGYASPIWQRGRGYRHWENDCPALRSDVDAIATVEDRKRATLETPSPVAPGHDPRGTPDGYVDQLVPLPGRGVPAMIRFPCDLTEHESSLLMHALVGAGLYARPNEGPA